MKKHEFIFNAPKQTVISHLMNGVIKAKSLEFYEEDEIYGKVCGDKLLLYHGIKYKNGFRPIFSAKITDNGKTVIKGFWKLPIPSIIFLLIWFGNLWGFGFLSLLKTINVMLVLWLLIFSVIGVTFVMTAFFFERNRMKKVIEYIAKTRDYINSNEIV